MSGARPSRGAAVGQADGQLEELQEELQALRQMRCSLRAVEHMAVCLNQNIQLAIKNRDRVAELNKGWQIFFSGQK